MRIKLLLVSALTLSFAMLAGSGLALASDTDAQLELQESVQVQETSSEIEVDEPVEAAWPGSCQMACLDDYKDCVKSDGCSCEVDYSVCLAGC